MEAIGSETNLLTGRHFTENTHVTQREIEVLALLSHGISNQKIADKLGISLYTEKNHLKSIFRKLHVNNRAQAIVVYLSQQWYN